MVPAAVCCYAGYKGEETPRSFVVAGKELVVEKVLDQWYECSVHDMGTEFAVWRVIVEDNCEYVLQCDRRRHTWKAALVL